MTLTGHLSIQEGSPSDLGICCQLWNEVWPDLRLNEAQLERDQQVLPPEQRSTFWLAKIDETTVGFAECHRDVGSYHPQKWTLNVGVLSENRGVGIGSQLFDRALQFVEIQDPISVMSRVSEKDEAALHFVAKRGFSEVRRQFESILHLKDLTEATLSAMDSASADILSAAELDSPNFRRELHRVFEIVRQDTPRAEPPTPLTFERFEELVLNDPEFLWQGTQIALVDGQIVGFSGIYSGDIEGQLFQWLTAVLKEHRGRKIAQTLKAKQARWAIANGYQTIRTDNDSVNAPMLAINDFMGFQRLMGMVTVIRRFVA